MHLFKCFLWIEVYDSYLNQVLDKSFQLLLYFWTLRIHIKQFIKHCYKHSVLTFIFIILIYAKWIFYLDSNNIIIISCHSDPCSSILFLFSRYRPDLIDFHTLDAKDSLDNLQFAFDLLEHELGISPVIKATELADVTKVPDKLTMMSYLSQVYDCFRREIPNVQQSMEGM